ncbi:MAG: hypothetical protein COB59_10595 [Rhodospirillaceae bacterium]|nr:MAG: hypothetical protein COB59_10595 [Rhodospirillaceae bacterium]
MLKRIKEALFSGDKNQTVARPQSDLKLASAALLVEAAVMDGQFDDAERTTIQALLQNRFELSEAETVELISDAEAAVEESSELYTLTRTIKNEFEHDERVNMIEMLWEVVYADGELDDYEANLVRRLNGLLHVSDRESGEARKRVLAKLGL